MPGMVKFLGANHDVTLSTLDRLGEVYYRLEQYQKASDCYQTVYNEFCKTFGPTHPSTLRALRKVARMNVNLHNVPLAVDLYRNTVVPGLIAVLGKGSDGSKRAWAELDALLAMMHFDETFIICIKNYSSSCFFIFAHSSFTSFPTSPISSSFFFFFFLPALEFLYPSFHFPVFTNADIFSLLRRHSEERSNELV